jgi:hypothetical protein
MFPKGNVASGQKPLAKITTTSLWVLPSEVVVRSRDEYYEH